jgi:8-oxo-dGTP pyrophosphatase MutT (NUDIX family)
MSAFRRQAAVVPYRIRRGRLEIALVTTSSGNGWILPKGWVDDDEHPRAAAIREAEEEAGLLGVLARQPLGRYRYVNDTGPRDVEVYLMRVTEVLEQWPEENRRRRRWMAFAEAAACLPREPRRMLRAAGNALGTDGR